MNNLALNHLPRDNECISINIIEQRYAHFKMNNYIPEIKTLRDKFDNYVSVENITRYFPSILNREIDKYLSPLFERDYKTQTWKPIITDINFRTYLIIERNVLNDYWLSLSSVCRSNHFDYFKTRLTMNHSESIDIGITKYDFPSESWYAPAGINRGRISI